MNLGSLKSGSDIRGIALGEGTTLTPDIVRNIGVSFVGYLAEQSGLPENEIRVSIGRDTRITGETLEKAVAQGIAAAGGQAHCYGLCTTPAMFMSIVTHETHMDGAIMVSASHHPYHLNGLKFFTARGGLSGNDITALLRNSEMLDEENLANNGTIIYSQFLNIYTRLLAQQIYNGFDQGSKPLLGLHVVVDAGNGSGGFYAKLLQDLGANIEGSQFLEPDGMFPNHIPNPENEVAMQSICKAVKDAKADLGVIFDTDCDRAAIVDEEGREINRNRLIALIAAILLKEKPGETIVTDSVTSVGLMEFIKQHGGIHHRYKRGYRNVIDEAIRLNENGISCPLAIETSGHAAMRENYFLDDGMYLVTRLIIEAVKYKQNGQNLSHIIKGLREPLESVELRLPIKQDDFKVAGEAAIDEITRHAKKDPGWHIAPDNHEGIRVSLDITDDANAGWFLLRLSIHDPVLPLNVESDIQGGVIILLKSLLPILENVKVIDLQPIRQYIQTRIH